MPLVSIVIPTCGRPQFLVEAIASALDDLGDRVEVVVVPNGPGEEWREALRPYAADRRIVVSPVATAHANVARNHGMRIATGKYLRFLDDDDLIIGGSTAMQCRLLEESGADICSGGALLMNARGEVFSSRAQPATEDLVAAVVAPRRATHTFAHVFRRDRVVDHPWDESINLGQDTHWMMALCVARDWPWIRLDDFVGIWRHHDQPRISASSRAAIHREVTASYLHLTAMALQSQGRLTPDRAASAASALWRTIHHGWFMRPAYWTDVMRKTQKLFPGTTPDIPFFRHPLGRHVPPLLFEAALFPKRWLMQWIRVRKFRRGQLSAALPP